MPASAGLDDAFAVHDELTGETWHWGEHNYVRLDPARAGAHPHRPEAAQYDRDARSVRARHGLDDAEAARPTGPDWFKRAVFYEVLVRSFKDTNGDGVGDLRGLTEKLDYLAWLGVDCLWLPPFFTSPLRDGGYDVSRLHRRPARSSAPSTTSPTFVDAAHDRGMRVIIDFVMNHTSRPAPVVPGVAQRPGRAVRRLLRVGRHRRALRRRADHLRRHRDVELDLRPGAQAVLLAPLLQPPARPQLRQPGGARGDARRAAVLARPRHRRLPARRRALPLRARGHQRREPPRDPRVPQAGARATSTTTTPDRVLLAEANQWPADVVDYFGDSDHRRRRVPHVLPLPGDAADLHGRAPRVALPDLGDPRRRRRRSRPTASGASSCATTTSSRSRWSPTRTATTCGPSTPRTRG